MSIEAPTFRGVLEDLVQVVRHLTAGERPVQRSAAREIALQATDPAELLLALAREVLDAFELDAFVAARLELDVLTPPPAPPALRGRVTGERFDPARHEAQPEIKAVTRHGLVAEPTPQGWRAELVFDV